MLNRLALYGVAAVVLSGALTAGYFQWRGHQRGIGAEQQHALDKAAMDKQKAEAAQKLAAAMAERDAIEQKLLAARQDQDIKDAKNRTTNASLSARLSALSANAGGRLRDPNADTGCRDSRDPPARSPTATASDSRNDGAETSGLLSVQLSDLLREKLREADEINAAYTSCRSSLLEGNG